MRLIYNRDYLFKGVPKTKQNAYYKRIFEFANDISREKEILSEYFKRKYSIKKMEGTKGIFKFVLDANDHSRCLIKYEDRDQQIFGEDPGIVLLMITSHDQQGELGRRLDKAFIDYSKFIEFDDAIGDDSNIDMILGKEYMRTIQILPNMSDQDFLQTLLDEDSRYIYKPSEKQYQALESNGPILLLGCAGSGKTLVEISKTLRNAHHSINQAYFTFTPSLKDMAQGIFNKYSQSPLIKGQTKFYSINEFCLQRLSLNNTNYFGYLRFRQWIKEAKIKEKYRWIKEVGTINLWIEIRGLIKGFMGNDYFRNLEISNGDTIFSSEQKKELLSKNIIEEHKHYKTTYHILESKKLFDYIQQFPILKNHMFHHDFDEPLIDKYTYMNLKDEYSRFGKDKREQIYAFVSNVYQKYLDEQGLYDDNDLARKNILHTYPLTKQLDFLLVDEVQDLTEMQIYMLIDLVKDPQQVLLSGDVSQVINPTFFRKGRSGLMFRNRKGISWDRSNVFTLNENYRNSRSIVDIANKIVDIRRSVLGTYTEDIVEISQEIEQSEGLPVLIETSFEEFLESIYTWQNAVRVAIIVSSDESKHRLIQKMKIKRSEAYHIYTVQEAKGQEFDRVLIYNILSDYTDIWDKIMESTDKKNATTYYQYYFNLFYVAVTRAKRNLYVYEDNKEMNVLEEIKPLFEVVNRDLIRILDPSENVSEEMIIKQAKELFDAEDFERARLNYLRVNKKKDALICHGFSHIKHGQFENGIKILYRFDEYHDYAYGYTDQKTLLFKIVLGYKLKKLSIKDIVHLLQRKSLLDLITPYQKEKTYIDLLSDVIELNTKIHQYHINEKLKEVLS